MARFVQITAYAKDSTQYASASPMLVNADNMVNVTNANLRSKMSVPSASGSINSQYVENDPDNNSGARHTYLIGETLGTLVTESA